MTHVSILSLGLLSLCALPLAAEEPKAKAETKAPYERLLEGDDAKKAAGLAKKIEELEAADKYVEALKAAEELLALRSRVQGANHWETVDQKWQIEQIKKVGALSMEERAGWRKTSEADDEAEQLEVKGKWLEALPRRQEQLKWSRRVLGEEHPDTASSYYNVADSLMNQRKYVDAALLFQKSLEIRHKVLGEEHPDTASSYNGVAANLNTQWKYAEAEPLYRKALEIARKVLGEEHSSTATYYNNVAANLSDQRKYAPTRGSLFFQKVSEIRRKVAGEENADNAQMYHNVACNLNAQGKYTEAAPLLQKALDIRRKVLGEEHPDTAVSYSSVATNLYGQRNFVDAAPLYQKALDILHKVLSEEHPVTAAGYYRSAVNLQALEKYADATRLFEKALAIRRKVLGEEHPGTAESYYSVAGILTAQAKYADAAPLYEKALDIRRKVLGEEHPDTAGSYGGVAANLTAQGKHSAAAPLLQKALDIRRKVLGEEHRDIALSYDSIAVSLEARGKFADATPLLQRALAIRLKVLGEEHPDTATGYSRVAGNLAMQGKYAEAAFLSQKALDIRRKVLGEEHSDTAQSYNNVATILSEQGKHAEAGPVFQKALDIYRKVLGEEHPDTATSFSNVAANLTKQEKYAEASPLSRKALDIRRKVLGEEHPDTVSSYNNIAADLNAQKKHAEAGTLYRKALDIRRKVLGVEHPHTAASFSSVGFNSAAQGKFAEAVPLFQKALDINRTVLGEEHPHTATSYDNVAYTLAGQGEIRRSRGCRLSSRAISSFEMARLGVAYRGLERADFGAQLSPYNLRAAIAVRLQQSAGAWTALENDLARGLLDDLGAANDSLFTADELRRRQELTQRLHELQPRTLHLLTSKDLSANARRELEALQTERSQISSQLAKLVAAVGQREVATLAQLRSALPPDAAWLAWLDLSISRCKIEEHWACLVRSTGEPIWEKLPATGAMGKWTEQDGELPRRVRQALSGGAPAAELAALRQRLYDQRLAPVVQHLQGVKRLFIVPAGRMAGVPVEALTDQFVIGYVPSGTLLARAATREKPRGEGALALGDPVFQAGDRAKKDEPLPPGGLLVVQVAPEGNAAKALLAPDDVLLRYAGVELTSVEQLGPLIQEKMASKSIEVTVWRKGIINVRDLAPGRLDVVLANDAAPKAIAERRKNDQMLVALNRGGQLQELPGTRIETAALKQLFGAKALVLTDSDASEQKLEELRKGGDLSKFRYLHFATHGAANNVQAFESILYLSQDKLPKQALLKASEPFINGELSAREVLEFWKLDAVLVTLSACETGLGRHGGGEGLLGFAQAFLSAGARSVCLSLWKVDDTATALLMSRFYQNLLGKRDGLTKPMPKAEALAEAKNWLRDLSSEEALKLTAAMTNGVSRGERGKDVALNPPPKVSKEAPPANGFKPFAHPRYWAAFILIGDPN